MIDLIVQGLSSGFGIAIGLATMPLILFFFCFTLYVCFLIVLSILQSPVMLWDKAMKSKFNKNKEL